MDSPWLTTSGQKGAVLDETRNSSGRRAGARRGKARARGRAKSHRQQPIERLGQNRGQIQRLRQERASRRHAGCVRHLAAISPDLGPLGRIAFDVIAAAVALHRPHRATQMPNRAERRRRRDQRKREQHRQDPRRHDAGEGTAENGHCHGRRKNQGGDGDRPIRFQRNPQLGVGAAVSCI